MLRKIIVRTIDWCEKIHITEQVRRKITVRTMDWCNKIHIIEQVPSKRIHMGLTPMDKETGYDKTWKTLGWNWSMLLKGSQREAIKAWIQEKPRLKAARAQRMMYSIPSDGQDFDGIMKNAGRKLERRSRTPRKIS